MFDNTPKTPTEDPTPEPVPTTTDQYMSALLRYCPPTVIGAYTAMTGLITSSEPYHLYMEWAIFALCLALSPLYVAFVKDSIPDDKDCSKRFHIVASFIAFAVWGFALGGPFKSLSFYSPVYGSLAIIVGTLIFPLLKNILKLTNFFKIERDRLSKP